MKDTSQYFTKRDAAATPIINREFYSRNPETIISLIDFVWYFRNSINDIEQLFPKAAQSLPIPGASIRPGSVYCRMSSVQGADFNKLVAGVRLAKRQDRNIRLSLVELGEPVRDLQNHSYIKIHGTYTQRHISTVNMLWENYKNLSGTLSPSRLEDLFLVNPIIVTRDNY
jgi:hypothetical protein